MDTSTSHADGAWGRGEGWCGEGHSKLIRRLINNVLKLYTQLLLRSDGMNDNFANKAHKAYSMSELTNRKQLAFRGGRSEK